MADEEKKEHPASLGSRLQGRRRYVLAGLVLVGIAGLGLLPAPEREEPQPLYRPAEEETAAVTGALVPVRRSQALRNPFAARTATAEETTESVATAVEPVAAETAPALPRWRGVLQGKTETLVLLEYEGVSRALGRGENVGPYTVRAIAADTVSVVCNGAEYVLYRTEE